MKILLSNDDGVRAPGLKALFDALQPLADVRVIAPDRNCSGASNSLTLHSPLRVEQLENGFYSVNGTPTDCVHIGTNSPMSGTPDLVVSGINDAPNMGDDVIYSGTVAAATEGRHMGFPAIAVSMGSYGHKHYVTAAKVVAKLVAQLQESPLTADFVLNVNVPNIPFEDVKGIRLTRLGRRHKAEGMIHQKDPRGHDIYWYGPVGHQRDDGPGTDFAAVNEGYVSVTPLTVDMTAHRDWQAMETWLEKYA
ncbi:MAG: 5'-nucleotidase SurE [Idiomarinaceae bacterium HL-53]|nr:MAG: 5'-nucleotidase SurE [Idiomarinaceae bacterium HL-53]CUS49118.1 5'-nucleotidase /3'-nucleotidase /exopolyphosphatase [Idiomarinaceae bacterium HL-53]